MIIRENKYTTESSRPRRVYENLIARYAFYYRSFAPPARRAGRLFPFSRKGGNAHTLHRTPKHVHDVSAACPPHTAAMTAARMQPWTQEGLVPRTQCTSTTHSWFPYDCLLCELCMYRLKKTLPRGGWQRSTGRYSDRKSSQSARKPNSFYILSKFAESGKFQDPPTSAIVPHCTTR